MPMRTLTRLEALSRHPRPIVFAAGAFDGVHLGHQAVLRRAREAADAVGGEAWVLTFDPHPLKVLRPDRAPALLTSTPHRLQLLRAHAVDGVVLLPFTTAFAEQDPRDFIAHVRATVPTLHAIVVGSNWTFGRGARGDVALLAELGAVLGFQAHVMEGVTYEAQPISSTRIRRAVANGDLTAAAAMLGRPFSIYGTVVHGTKIGRQLGYPTANVDPHNEVRPPPGIYACRTTVEGRSYKSAAFLTADPDPRKGPPDVVEVHLLDVTLDLYELDIDVQFVCKLRDEWRFDSLEALKKQITVDIEATRSVLDA